MNDSVAIPFSSLPQSLSFLWLEITSKCNLECLHCYANSGPHQQLVGTMGTQDWLAILRDARSVGCHQVQFIGGEPTLHPDLSLMISFAAEQGYSFLEVYTNATKISDQLLRSFLKYRVCIAVSFYSDDAAVHDQITKRRGSFNHTVENLRRLLSAGLQVRAGIVVMPENRGHSERAGSFLRELGVTNIECDFRRAIGRGIDPHTSVDPAGELCGQCWKGMLCVTSAGRTYPCIFARFADLGSAKDGITHILEADCLRNFRVSLRDRLEERGDVPHLVQTASTGCQPKCNPQSFPQCHPPGIRFDKRREPHDFPVEI